MALGILLGACRCAWPLDPSLGISQYAHTAWKIREGFTKGLAETMAQTPDGYLWLGTEFGLVRFDGVRTVPWQPPPGEDLPDNRIRSLLVARDGALWIGTRTGLARWKDGKLTRYAELAGQDVYSLLQDREGTIWVGGDVFPKGGKLCFIRDAAVRCDGEDGRFGVGPSSLYEDRRGNLWVGAPNGLWRWKPGSPKLYATAGVRPRVPGVWAVIEGEHGEPLFATASGIRHLVDGKMEPYALPDTTAQTTVQRLWRDRDGALWIGTTTRGLLHVRLGRTDAFTESEGLSSDDVSGLFEDREGSIWVATGGGFDRFRDLAVPTISTKQGLSSHTKSVLAAKDGTIWLGTSDGLDRWKDGKITIYRRRSAPGIGAAEPAARAAKTVRETVDSGLPDDSADSLAEDDRGRLWVSAFGGVARLENGRFIRIPELPHGYVHSIAAAGEGDMWISNQNVGLFHLVGTRIVEEIPWSALGRDSPANALVPDAVQGGLWLGFFAGGGGVVHFKEGRVRASFGEGNGLPKGYVADLRLDREGALWVSAKGGLSRIKDGRVSTLSGKNGLPCDAVHWSMEDDIGFVWMETACGLMRIASRELDAWAVDPTRNVRIEVFGSVDGVRIHSDYNVYHPQVAKSLDGRIWFLPSDGVSVIDPRHLPFNKLPPPVHIEQITADRTNYQASAKLRLPPLIRDLQIDYTALSLVAPEKVLFRYKLEGRDRDWQDAGNRRQAFYSDLPPGNYRFRVIASNNSGVWNEQGDALDFSIAPAYWQTNWFRAGCAAVFLALLWVAYWLRMRHLARQFNLTLEARVGERTRIARDLHDTLLQSFHGLLLSFQTVSNQLQPGRIKEQLDRAIDQAAEAITEGREAVQALRVSAVETNDLALALKTFAEGLAPDRSDMDAAAITVVVEGASRTLHPILRDEIYRVGCEAVRNASRHAAATQIEVELRYDDRQLRLRVRDDGKGIDPAYLGEQGRAGHFGLHGMRERARLVGGKLTVWSAVNGGTEVELTIPANRAYAALSSDGPSWLVRKLSREVAQDES